MRGDLSISRMESRDLEPRPKRWDVLEDGPNPEKFHCQNLF